MRHKFIVIIRRCIFLVILVLSLHLLNILLMPKYSYSNSDWPTTATFSGFYDMEKDSVDVLFFGSSVAACAFNPQEIYNRSLIRSYNLSSEQQSLFLSYYWLREALGYQSPKAVVVDLKFLFPMHSESPINTTEPITRKCLDIMRNSSVKREAVRNLCAVDPQQSELSYYFTNIRFHSRWSSLDEQDFTPADYNESPLKGYAPLSRMGMREFEPLQLTGAEGVAECDRFMMEYLDRIDDLCRERGIKLILTFMAEEGLSEEKHNVMQNYADDHGLPLYDFSEESLYDRVGARLRKENIVDHPNLWGAKKLSCFMADELKDVYGIEGVRDRQWEDSQPFYEHMEKTCELVHIENLKDFFERLDDPDFTILLVVKEDGAGVVDDELADGMKSVGLSDLREYAGQSYLAVVRPGSEPVELHSDQALSYSVSLGEGRSVAKLSSMGFRSGDACSITLDGKELTNSDEGLHIVVYDNIQKKVIDIKNLE